MCSIPIKIIFQGNVCFYIIYLQLLIYSEMSWYGILKIIYKRLLIFRSFNSRVFKIDFFWWRSWCKISQEGSDPKSEFILSFGSSNWTISVIYLAAGSNASSSRIFLVICTFYIKILFPSEPTIIGCLVYTLYMLRLGLV